MLHNLHHLEAVVLHNRPPEAALLPLADPILLVACSRPLSINALVFRHACIGFHRRPLDAEAVSRTRADLYQNSLVFNNELSRRAFPGRTRAHKFRSERDNVIALRRQDERLMHSLSAVFL